MVGLVVGHLRGWAQEEVPVDRIGDGHRAFWTRDALRPPAGRAVGPGVNLVHRADGPVPHPLNRATPVRMGVPLIAHLGYDVHRVGRFHQRPCLPDGSGQRLLDVDVQSALHRLLRGDGVEVVRGRDDDPVDFVFQVVEHAAVVGVALGLLVRLVQGPEPVRHVAVAVAQRLVDVVEVDVADGDDVLARHRVHVTGAPSPDADARDVEGVARGLVAGAAQNGAGHHTEARGGQGRSFQKRASVHRVGVFTVSVVVAERSSWQGGSRTGGARAP